MAADVGKSYKRKENVVLQYCVAHTMPSPAVQRELMEATRTHPDWETRMLGAPEVLALNTTIIKAKNAKKILDIGVFTGASALASALSFTDARFELLLQCKMRLLYQKM